MLFKHPKFCNADKVLHITVACKLEDKVMDENTSRTDIQQSNSATCGAGIIAHPAVMLLTNAR